MSGGIGETVRCEASWVTGSPCVVCSACERTWVMWEQLSLGEVCLCSVDSVKYLGRVRCVHMSVVWVMWCVCAAVGSVSAVWSMTYGLV